MLSNSLNSYSMDSCIKDSNRSWRRNNYLGIETLRLSQCFDEPVFDLVAFRMVFSTEKCLFVILKIIHSWRWLHKDLYILLPWSNALFEWWLGDEAHFFSKLGSPTKLCNMSPVQGINPLWIVRTVHACYPLDRIASALPDRLGSQVYLAC